MRMHAKAYAFGSLAGRCGACLQSCNACCNLRPMASINSSAPAPSATTLQTCVRQIALTASQQTSTPVGRVVRARLLLGPVSVNRTSQTALNASLIHWQA
jgi:hypothetical protein